MCCKTTTTKERLNIVGVGTWGKMFGLSDELELGAFGAGYFCNLEAMLLHASEASIVGRSLVANAKGSRYVGSRRFVGRATEYFDRSLLPLTWFLSDL